MTIALPEPKIISHSCEHCDGYGYADVADQELLSKCGYCNGRGVVFTHLVSCPVHRRVVARSPEGGLLGKCDRCAAEAAQALPLMVRAA
jgi:DnaJ-class molecular chaperone